MGNRVSRVVGCFAQGAHDRDQVVDFFANPTLDEGLGHSFCYVRPYSEAFSVSPSHSDRYTSEPHSSSFRSHKNASETVAFRTISGASVSANTSTPHTILSHEQFHSFANVPDDQHAAFQSTGSFVSIPLQPVPRGVTFSGPISSTFSGPIPASLERVFMSGPLERSHMSGPIDVIQMDQTHFSAPITGQYHNKRSQRQRNLSRLVNAVGKPVKGAVFKTMFSTLARTRRSLVVPVCRFVWRRIRNGGKEASIMFDSNSELRYGSSDADPNDNHNLQWAQGKAGEDRVHVVVSEDHGWLFVGIYDGFNGPDAPDFLMRNLYRAVYRELQGLLWDVEGHSEQGKLMNDPKKDLHQVIQCSEKGGFSTHKVDLVSFTQDCTICSSRGSLTRSRTLREYLERDDSDEEVHTGLSEVNHEAHSFSMPLPKRELSSCSCNHGFEGQSLAENLISERASDSAGVAEDSLGSEAMTFKNTSSGSSFNLHLRGGTPGTSSVRNFTLPSSRHKQARNKESHRKLLPQRESEFKEVDQQKCTNREVNPWKEGEVDHNNVLKALARALKETEEAYLHMADIALEDNPELLLMGSCILVALVKDKDVYILNVGDSRAIVAQELNKECLSLSSSSTDSTNVTEPKDLAVPKDLNCILEDRPVRSELLGPPTDLGAPASSLSLSALQLSADHSTSIEEEVQRIKLEHPDDSMCILNDRVKGRLKVTRAFGAGYLKKPRWNDAVLKMFQIDYVGSDPYVTCAPALHHHRLGPNDRFLVLSSDGLYQYFSNKEVVSHVEWFMQRFPEGDPAQHLIEELLSRAAKKAGMDFHELLDIPQGDRRKYHDDVSVMVISLDGKVWRSSS